MNRLPEKKTIVIVGAGQMGRAVSQLLNPNRTLLLGFADNDKSKWSSEKPPVFSMETAVNLKPDEIIISVLGDERARALMEQLRVCRFYGEVTFLKDLHKDFDIRSRVLKNMAGRIERSVPGAIAELGVYRGDTAWQMNALLPDRELYLFDTFEGFDERDLASENEKNCGATGKPAGIAGDSGNDSVQIAEATGRRGKEDFSDTSEFLVLSRMPHPEKCIIRKGYFPETAEGLEDVRYALVSLDPDLYEPVLSGLEYFWPRMNEGGAIIVHDYDNAQFPGARRAVEEFERGLDQSLKLVLLADLHGSCVIIR